MPDLPGMGDGPALVVLLTGPSGSGKSSLARRAGLPVLGLDRFYKNGTDPSLPRRGTSVDWDDPATWNREDALDAVHRLAVSRRASVPTYDLRQNRRVGGEILEVGSAPAFVAEGIFAALLVGGCRALGVLGDALCLHQPRQVTFLRRLVRDIGEGRKSPMLLLRRGVALARAENETVDQQVAHGAHLCRPDEALHRLRLAAHARHLVPVRAVTFSDLVPLGQRGQPQLESHAAPAAAAEPVDRLAEHPGGDTGAEPSTAS
jgi:uridine kinase